MGFSVSYAMDNFIVKGYSQELEIQNFAKEHYFTGIYFSF